MLEAADEPELDEAIALPDPDPDDALEPLAPPPDPDDAGAELPADDDEPGAAELADEELLDETEFVGGDELLDEVDEPLLLEHAASSATVAPRATTPVIRRRTLTLM